MYHLCLRKKMFFFLRKRAYKMDLRLHDAAMQNYVVVTVIIDSNAQSVRLLSVCPCPHNPLIVF